jgi:glycine cleavage system protein P-like pyridoxal-binding family
MSSGSPNPEYIEAKNDLSQKVRKIRRLSPADDPVKRAEAALKILSSHFDDWMIDEIRMMHEARDAWRAAGYATGEARDTFYRSVHDIKGQSTTLGFPLATQVAASLCALVERVEKRELVPLALIDKHVDALRAIVREKAKDEDDRVGAELVDALIERANAYIAEFGTPEVIDFEDIFVPDDPSSGR